MWSPCWIGCYISDWIAWVDTELVMMDKSVLNLQQLNSKLMLHTTQINISGSCLVLLYTCRSQCQCPYCPQWEMEVFCIFSGSEDSLCLESRQNQEFLWQYRQYIDSTVGYIVFKKLAWACFTVTICKHKVQVLKELKNFWGVERRDGLSPSGMFGPMLSADAYHFPWLALWEYYEAYDGLMSALGHFFREHSNVVWLKDRWDLCVA